MNIRIEQVPAGSGAVCREILDELAPEWFGMPASNAAYAHEAETGPAWLAFADDKPVGVMVLKRVSEDTTDIHVIAVRRALHRGGVGRQLIAAAETEARRDGCALLSVKTLGPSDDSAEYARTRRFYRGVGFYALEEIAAIWGPESPCLIMVMPLTARSLA